ncbi:MAG: DUF1549 domain-containing protein [Gemmataceae bacterium]|nr:DUF1549 domain-containing protein [Gemmataceae bacterium]
MALGTRSLVAVLLFSGMAPAADPPAVSFVKDVRPLLQTHCFGCHQPARAQGGFVMTEAGRLRAGGDSGDPAVTPKAPDKSELLARIRGIAGHAIMPPGDARKLTAAEIAVIENWIKQGAADDSPPATALHDDQHPPTYTRPPVVSALDVSPDGRFIAVSGFHETLLHRADGTGIEARLIGLAERIESIRFSPDGKLLAVAGGLPGRLGELQVWDVAKKKLKLSVPVSADTLYGVSWSPDGKLIAFGSADGFAVRAVDASTGKQVLYQGAHNDWVLGTVFSVDGKELVSVGRDRSCKLTEVATQRFIDNITSITPGALRGGLLSIARHPTRDEVIVGGADGQPRIYRLARLTARVIGDDGNLIRQLPAITGRVWSVAVTGDGKRIIVGGGLDAAGEVAVYGYEFDTKLPERIKAINAKVVTSRSAAEKAELENYYVEGVKVVSKAKVPAGVYAVAVFPDGKQFVAAGGDGTFRIYETETAKQTREWPVAPAVSATVAKTSTALTWPEETVEPDPVPAGIREITVEPAAIELNGPVQYAQVVVTARMNDGTTRDVTRAAKLSGPDWLEVTRAGLIRPRGDGAGQVTIEVGDRKATVAVRTTGATAGELQPDFVRDVAPALSRVGCNAGTCHGSKDGKNGFKLSLRGYDPIFDVRALTDEHAARRTSIASPADSLMLLKATGAVPHAGGQVMRTSEPYYRLIHDWIARGAKLNPASTKVARIAIMPAQPVVETIGARQQFRVVATFADGTTRDVTREAFLESGNSEAVRAEKNGLCTTLRRGEAPILARYEGAYAATTLTVMGDRNGFVWEEPARFNTIDEFTAAKWKRMKIRPSDLCTDAEFLRRVSLDLTGLPPTADQVRAFIADARPTQVKRDALVDQLVGSPEYVEHWTNKWADLLQVNRKYLGTEGSAAFRGWIRRQLADNVPYDRFAAGILTASGSNKDNPPASYFKTLRQPAETMENTTHLFLAVRFNCNKCHDHPFERWTQDQYYQLAAFFARYSLARDPASGNRTIGGSEVEKATPYYEVVSDAPAGEVQHDRTGEVTQPAFPYPAESTAKADAPRRQQLTQWMTSADNMYFARSYVNRLWGYLFGVGIIEPIDDIRAGNPPTNPELLDWLTGEFVKSGFNVRHMHRLMCKSRTYQLSVSTHKWNDDDKTNFSHALARRLPAEVLFDAVCRTTGHVSQIPGLPPGARAAALPDSGVELPGGFLNTLGRPPRESACECERATGLQLGPVMALVTGQVLNDAVGDGNNAVAKLVASEPDDGKLIQEMFVRILNRPANEREVGESRKLFSMIDADHARLSAALAAKEKEWAPKFVKLQEERDGRIADAHRALGAYKKTEYEPRRAREEAERLTRIKTAEKDLAAYEATLAGQRDAWAKKHAAQPEWHVLKPTSVKANKPGQFRVEPDGAVFVADGAKDATLYTFVTTTNVKDIQGIRLEALADARLPAKGPGRAENGNFVLSQIEIFAAPLDKPGEAKKVELRHGLADFSQQTFSPNKAIDGNTATRNEGWAISPQFGEDHWVTYETATPVGHPAGTVLTIKLHQSYRDKKHTMGRFRLSVTTSPKPGLSFPEHVITALRRAADERSPEENSRLTALHSRTDEKRIQLTAAVAEANRPLPPDMKLRELEAAVASAERPIAVDPALLQLRADHQLSDQQMKQKRLTAAQDLTWALLNSPAFLFNR